jgi:biotin carboxyl carrier protein
VDERPTGISDPAAERPALARLAEDVLPALIARLDVSELGELEVRHDGWRVRLRRSTPAPPPTATPTGQSRPSPSDAATPPVPAQDGNRRVTTSPAVGYYAPNDHAVVGREVASGDVLGWVDVLGVRQEVVAAAGGVVGRLLAEPGQAVEYGQELLVIDLRRGIDAADAGADGPGQGTAAPIHADPSAPAPADPPVAD